MIDTKLKNHLLSLHGKYNMKLLVDHMENSTIQFLVGTEMPCLAFASVNKIYFNLKFIENYPPRFLTYIILHELGHVRRIQKMGKGLLIELLSTKDFEMFFQAVVNEEIIADRYATAMFFRFTGSVYPWSQTQQLDFEFSQYCYRSSVEPLFGKVENTEESYEKYVKLFIGQTCN